MAGVRDIAVLGATGSIGASALDVIARHPERLRASVLAAGRQVEALIDLCVVHRPAHAVIADPSKFIELRDGLRTAGLPTQAHTGDEALEALAASGDVCDTVVAAIVGAAGLRSTLAAAHDRFDAACRDLAARGAPMRTTRFGAVPVADFVRFLEIHTRHHNLQIGARRVS